MSRRRKILLAAVIVFAVLAAGLFYYAHVRPKRAVAAYMQKLRDSGAKLEISELIPPPVPAQSNSVEFVREAFRLLTNSPGNVPDQMIMVAPGRAMVGWAQPDARDKFTFTNSWTDFAAEIATVQPALNLLHEVLDLPVLEFGLDYRKGVTMLFPYLAPMKRAALKLNAAAICELHYDHVGAATTNTLTILGVARKNAGYGPMISYLVRIAIAGIGAETTWELLQKTNLPDAEMAALQRGWGQLDFFTDAQSAFLMERVWSVNATKMFRNSPEEFDKLFGPDSFYFQYSYGNGGSSGEAVTERFRYAVGKAMWCSSWSYSDELHGLKSATIALQTLRAMQTNQSQFYMADLDAMKTNLATQDITRFGVAFFDALKIPDFSEIMGGDWLAAAVRKTISSETERRIVVTAIALKRFQQKHGQLPQTLNELVPEFLPSVFIDPYSGQPLRYRPNPDGTYLLYSVGENGVDDGGNPSDATGRSLYLQNSRALDWVWPQPATPAEIRAYYAKQANAAE